MNNKDKKMAEVQGADTIKKQTKSISYAIKAIGEHAKTLKKAGYMRDDMYAKFEDWRTTVGGEFLKKQLGINEINE